MRYLLDTNAIVALLNDTVPPIARRVRRHAPHDFGVPAIVIHELYYGAFQSRRVEQNVARVDALQLSVLEFGEEDARQSDSVWTVIVQATTYDLRGMLNITSMRG